MISENKEQSIEENIDIVKHIKTNIKAIDELFNNGLSNKSTNLLIYNKEINFDNFIEDLIFKEENEKIGMIVLTTDKAPEKYLEKHLNLEEKNIKWIDAYSMIKDENVKDTNEIKRVSGPIALTDIAIQISNISKEFYAKNLEGYKILIDSLQTFLLFNNADKIIYFLQTIISKVTVAEGTLFFSMQENVVNEKLFEKLEVIMDNVILINKEKIQILKTKENKEKNFLI
jgi:hypothetical protein